MPNKLNQKQGEQAYFEMFRKHYPLPVGTIRYGDKPDVILKGERKIGIEITNFYKQEGEDPQSLQVQRDIREQVISEAQGIYQKETGKKFELTFAFDETSPIRNKKKDKKKLVQKIVELARRIEEKETGGIGNDIFQGIPELSLVYLYTGKYEDGRWKDNTGANIELMSIEKLRKKIKEKEAKAKEYKSCDAYWVLLVVDWADLAQDQEIRIDNLEKMESEVFEKIFVYKPQAEHILEVK